MGSGWTGGDGRGEDPDGSAEGLSGAGFVRAGIWFYGAMAVVAVLWRSGLYGEPVFFVAAGDGPGISWGRDVGLGVVLGGAVLLLSALATRASTWGERLSEEMSDLLANMSVPDALLMAAVSGLAEEMFFRGALQPRAGLIIASLLFGAVHFVPRAVFLPWTVFAVISGLGLGWLFEHTGNLVAPVVAHTLVNAVNLPLLARQGAQRQEERTLLESEQSPGDPL